MLDIQPFTHLSFDCYGTLIDWEAGILEVLTPLAERHGKAPGEYRLLHLYTQLEAKLETGEYTTYREVLRGVVAGLGEALGFTPSEEELSSLPDSVGDWPPFPDTVESLRRLGQSHGLVILSNTDDDLFAGTQRRLGIDFAEVVTAQQLHSYKPAPAHFQAALQRLEVDPSRILHVAQSLYHDHVPAKALGFTTVWVNRPSRLAGTGLAPAVPARPDFEVPDLASLVALLGV